MFCNKIIKQNMRMPMIISTLNSDFFVKISFLLFEKEFAI